MVYPASHRVSRVRRYSGSCSMSPAFAYGAFTLFGLTSQLILLAFLNSFRSPQPLKYYYSRFGLFPFRSPLLWESHVVFFSSPYLDVSVQAVPLHTLWIGVWMTEVLSAGFPHSDISGSLDICSSPKLFAAYHVFHRLLVPRHPPCALNA